MSNSVIAENNQILKSVADKKVFLEALLNPLMPNAQLKKALSNYNQFAATHSVQRTAAAPTDISITEIPLGINIQPN